MCGSRGTAPFAGWARGRYEIRASGLAHATGLNGAYTRLKRLVIGEPLATAAAGHERLTKLKALAVLSSDALSSVAYATEEIMRVLLLAGTAALTAVAADRRGAGRPAVRGRVLVPPDDQGLSDRRRQLHRRQGQPRARCPGWPPAGSLLTSYTLTVAVSVAAGVKALTSAYPDLDPFATDIGVAVVMLITIDQPARHP